MEVHIPFCSIFFAILIGLFMVIDTKHHSRNDLEDSEEVTSHHHHPSQDWVIGYQEENHKRHHHDRSHGHMDHAEGRSLDQDPNGRSAKNKPKPPKTQSLQDFRAEGLKFHNKYRAAHGTPPLTMDDELNELAEQWAQEISDGSDAVKKIVLSHTPDMTKGSNGGGTGDNVFACKCFDITGERAVNQWYSEEKKYNYNKPSYHWTYGHYTQLIWKATTKMGMAKIKSPIMGFVIVVATYLPRANMNYTKSYRDNVLPLLTKDEEVAAAPPADGENGVVENN